MSDIQVAHRTVATPQFDGSTPPNRIADLVEHELGIVIEDVFVPFVSRLDSYVQATIAAAKSESSGAPAASPPADPAEPTVSQAAAQANAAAAAQANAAETTATEPDGTSASDTATEPTATAPTATEPTEGQ